MKLSTLIKVKGKTKKRIGRGIGTGKGKTSARGMKGQKARGKIPLRFTGGVALYRKLPLKRGQGNPKLSQSPKIIKLSILNLFNKGEVVDIDQLVKLKIINEHESRRGVKILNVGKIDKSLVLKLPVSKSVKESIEKSGGKVENA
jgi:large subunit ribosomal protein L15